MNCEHIEILQEKDYPELSEVKTQDIHIIDYDDGKLHCTEIFSKNGPHRAYAKTIEEAVHKAVKVYKDSNYESASGDK